MSATVKKLLETQVKEIAILKVGITLHQEEIAILKDEIASQGKALDSKPSVADMDALLEENEALVREALSRGKGIEAEPCALHRFKECANLKCIPIEVAEE